MALLQGQEQLKEAMEGESLWITIKAVTVTTTRKQHVIPKKPHFRYKIYSQPLMTPTELHTEGQAHYSSTFYFPYLEFWSIFWSPYINGIVEPMVTSILQNHNSFLQRTQVRTAGKGKRNTHTWLWYSHWQDCCLFSLRILEERIVEWMWVLFIVRYTTVPYIYGWSPSFSTSL